MKKLLNITRTPYEIIFCNVSGSCSGGGTGGCGGGGTGCSSGCTGGGGCGSGK